MSSKEFAPDGDVVESSVFKKKHACSANSSNLVPDHDTSTDCGFIRDRVLEESEDAVKRALLEKYAPRIYLAEGETAFPSSVDYLLDGMSRIYQDGNWQLRVEDPGIRAGQSTSEAPVYAFHYQDGDVTYLTYFFLYGYNFGKTVFFTRYGDHDGDWEHLSVRLTGGTPDFVALASHSFFNTVPWADMEKVGKHPVAFAALGSHGVWSTTGTKNYGDIVIADLKDVCSRGEVWDTWNRMEAFDWNSKTTLPGNQETTQSSLPTWLEDGADISSTGNADPRSGPIRIWGFIFEDEKGCSIIGQCRKNSGPTGPNYKKALTDPKFEFAPQGVFYEGNSLEDSRVCSLTLAVTAEFDVSDNSPCRNDEIRSAIFTNVEAGTRIRVCDASDCSFADDVTDVFFKTHTPSLIVDTFEQDVDTPTYSVTRTRNQGQLDGKISRLEITV